MAPKSFAKHHERLAQAQTKAAETNQIVETSQTQYAKNTIITSSGSSSSIVRMPLPSQPLLFLPPPPPPPPATLASVNDSVTLDVLTEPSMPKKPTQTSETLQEFLSSVPMLLDMMLEHATDDVIGEPCTCNRHDAIKTVRCYDCTHYDSSCVDCYLEAHYCRPFHWAEVWDFQRGFFVRTDIAMLKQDISSINLGHSGAPCPSRHTENLYFTAVDINGIHNTKIRFCMCKGKSRVAQLMKARLFPATISQPTTAFTFQVLHQFHIHHLDSKESVHDFIASLRHLTDNAFPQHIKDISSQFRMAMRIWRLLKARKRSGDALDISQLLSHRRKFIVHCPVCPDPRINMEPGWQDTPRELCHLNQTQFTADGNHHSNCYLKNTDPDDVSLFEGHAYFPNDHEYCEYVKNLPKSTPEKSGPCDHLTALNSQDRKKFKNMDITGIVMINCSHIFIKSTVDLQLGEKFANTDYALSHAIRNTKPADSASCSTLDDDFATKCDHRQSYDISCGFGVNAPQRFEENFPDEADFVKNTQYLIPLLHVQNHRDNCTYLFSSAYQPNAGHFQGETAEQPWIELNQLAPQTRQMNNGHRQDTISDHHSHSNWNKMINMAATLFQDITWAKKLFDKKHEEFKGLTIGQDKEVQCVYRQRSTGDVPSRTRIYQALISDLSDDTGKAKSTLAPLASFLNEGITILEQQRQIHALDLKVRQDIMKTDVTRTQAARDKALNLELQSKRTQLETEIGKWRKKQKSIAPQLGDLIIQDSISGKAADRPENQTLFMPSDLTPTQRQTLDLERLGNMEYKLHEGIACDSIQKLRTIVKVHGALVIDKATHSKGQKQNTRSNSQIEEVASQRDQVIAEYMTARRAMVKLGGISENSTDFPPLTIQDTIRKNPHSKRALGDSRRDEGRLWTNSATAATRPGPSSVEPIPTPVPLGAATSESSASTSIRHGSGPTTAEPVFGTQLVTRKPLEPDHKRGVKGTKRRIEELQVSTASDNPASSELGGSDGWIWSFRPRHGMSDREVEEWLSEGDRVQWFRAEAEMQRWQEEWEIKKVEFLRCIRSYAYMSQCWTELSGIHDDAGSKGRAAYAKRQAAMYRQMENDARKLLHEAGYGELLALKDNDAIVQHIRDERRKTAIPELEPQGL